MNTSAMTASERLGGTARRGFVGSAAGPAARWWASSRRWDWSADQVEASMPEVTAHSVVTSTSTVIVRIEIVNPKPTWSRIMTKPSISDHLPSRSSARATVPRRPWPLPARSTGTNQAPIIISILT